ncbi:hypothetical protein ACVQK1_09205 [Edwardsiella tarda]
MAAIAAFGVMMKLVEMEGFLNGKCLPGDMKVNETNAEYLFRKFSELEVCGALLDRYSMSAGQADQRMAESRAVRKALGFNEEADDVSPADLVERINDLRSQGVEMLAKHMRENGYASEANGAEEFASQLRKGMKS